MLKTIFFLLFCKAAKSLLEFSTVKPPRILKGEGMPLPHVVLDISGTHVEFFVLKYRHIETVSWGTTKSKMRFGECHLWTWFPKQRESYHFFCLLPVCSLFLDFLWQHCGKKKGLTSNIISIPFEQLFSKILHITPSSPKPLSSTTLTARTSKFSTLVDGKYSNFFYIHRKGWGGGG